MREEAPPTGEVLDDDADEDLDSDITEDESDTDDDSYADEGGAGDYDESKDDETQVGGWGLYLGPQGNAKLTRMGFHIPQEATMMVLAQPVSADLRFKRMGAEVMAGTVMHLLNEDAADMGKLLGWR
jgi:hypothetical protein